MSNQIIRISDLKIKDLTFSKVKEDKNMRKMVYMNDNGNKVRVQMPKITGYIKRWTNRENEDDRTKDSFVLDVDFRGKDTPESEKLLSAYNKFLELDDLIKKVAIENHDEWTKPLTKKEKDAGITHGTHIESQYKPLIIEDATGEWSDKLKPVKLYREKTKDSKSLTGKFTGVSIYDDNKQEIEVDDQNIESIISRGSKIIPVLEFCYISLSNNTISPIFKLVQAKVSKSVSRLEGYSILDDDEAEVVNEEVDVETEDMDTETPVVADKNVIEESDSETEEEEPIKKTIKKVELDSDSEEEVKPVVKSKKTVVRSKKA